MSLILSGTDGLSDVDGTAATPAIRGTDANTGIFFPAADTIAFSEGGVEAARFDSAGNLLVGGTSNAAGARLVSENTSGNQLGLRYSSVATWYNSIDSSGNYIWTKDGSEKARIDSSGNLGIGTTSPVGKVDVQQSTTDMVGLSILNTNSSVGTTTSSQVRLGITNSAGVSYAVIKAQEASADDYPALTFGVQNAVTTTPTERARITSSGKLLVGTTSSPSSAKLTVAGGLSVNNNTDNSTSDNNYGSFFAKTVGSVSASTTTTIKNAVGSEASMHLVAGVNSGLGIRFFDIVVTMGSGMTPVVVSSGTLNSPPARTYSMSGENLQINFGGANAFVVRVTGMGSNEA